MDHLLFNGWEPLLRIILVGISSYIALVALLRASGKRALSRLNMYDFVISMAIGSILAKILLSNDVSLSESVMAMAVLIALQYLFSWASVRYRWFRRMVCADPALLFHDGHYLKRAMLRERIAKQDVQEAMHEKGINDAELVEAVILSSNGQLSVILKKDVLLPASA